MQIKFIKKDIKRTSSSDPRCIDANICCQSILHVLWLFSYFRFFDDECDSHPLYAQTPQEVRHHQAASSGELQTEMTLQCEDAIVAHVTGHTLTRSNGEYCLLHFSTGEGKWRHHERPIDIALKGSLVLIFLKKKKNIKDILDKCISVQSKSIKCSTFQTLACKQARTLEASGYRVWKGPPPQSHFHCL